MTILSSVCSISLALSVLLAGQAQKSSGPAAKKPPKKLAFESLDTDHNGILIRDEFLGGTLGKAAEAKLEEFKKLDADRSGALDFEEFKKYQPARRTPAELKQAFARLDKNADDKLTAEELAADPAAPSESASRRTFLRLDANGDGSVTLEEFQRGPDVKVTPTQQFHIRDLNSDGQLDREEFLKPSVGRPFHEAAKAAFVRADVDHNGVLNVDEYLLTRVAEPSAETVFRVLDGDKQDRLTPEELTRTMTPQHAATIRQSFDQFDVDHDGTWDATEYEAWKRTREGEKQQAKGPQHSLASYSVWLAAPVVTVGVLLAVFARSRWRRGRQQMPPLPVQPPQRTPDKRRPPEKPKAAESQRASSADDLGAMSDASRPSSPSARPVDEQPSMEDFEVE